MSRARITFQGAYHHAMSRGHEGKPIYEYIKMKQHFLHLLKGKYNLFSDVKFNSLGSMYTYARKKMKR